MLRITKALKNVHSVALKLEGKITDDWVNLLEQECRAWISQKQSVCLDFSDVSYVDPSGVEMMGKLPIGKVSIINPSDFIIDLLHLRGKTMTEISIPQTGELDTLGDCNGLVDSEEVLARLARLRKDDGLLIDNSSGLIPVYSWLAGK